jgi:hypothetical protein
VAVDLSIGWLLGCLVAWLVDRLAYRLLGWLIDWGVAGWLVGVWRWAAVSREFLLCQGSHWLIVWLTYRTFDRSIDGLIDRSIDWLLVG